jgi:hypothetical protein
MLAATGCWTRCGAGGGGAWRERGRSRTDRASSWKVSGNKVVWGARFVESNPCLFRQPGASRGRAALLDGAVDAGAPPQLSARLQSGRKDNGAVQRANAQRGKTLPPKGNELLFVVVVVVVVVLLFVDVVFQNKDMVRMLLGWLAVAETHAEDRLRRALTCLRKDQLELVTLCKLMGSL